MYKTNMYIYKQKFIYLYVKYLYLYKYVYKTNLNILIYPLIHLQTHSTSHPTDNAHIECLYM